MKCILKRAQVILPTLILFLIAIGCMTWVGLRIQQAKRQQKAVAILEQMGAVVDFDYEVDGDGELTGKESPSPNWFNAICGRDVCSRVVAVSFSHCQRPNDIDDQTLVVLDDLPGIKHLDLQFTGISGKGLVHLAHLGELNSLNLGNTDIGDCDIAHLSRLRRLRWLSLCDTRLSDAGIKHISGLAQIKTLDISGTSVTDVGLRRLSALSRLEFLFAKNTEISTQGAAQATRALPNCHISLGERSKR